MSMEGEAAPWCSMALYAVSSLLCRYDDDQIAGGDKERYAR